MTATSRWARRRLGRVLAASALVAAASLALANEALFDLVEEGPPEAVLTAVREGADPNVRDTFAATPLMVAAAANHDVAVTRILLDAGAVVDAQDAYGWTALMRAAWLNPNPEVARALIRAGAALEVRDLDGRTALMHAALNPNQDVVRVLLDAGADVTARDDRGRTALLIAAERAPRAETVAALLDARSDVDVRDDSGATALELAAANPALTGSEVVQRLEAPQTPAPPATAPPPPAPTIAALIANLATEPRGFLAIARDGTVDDVGAALAAGADVAVTDDFGQTPLMYAVSGNGSDVIERLIAAGAEVDARNVADWTPLMYAARRGASLIAAALLRHGADPNAVDDTGRTAAGIALAEGHESTAQLLRDEAARAAVAAANAPTPVTAAAAAAPPPPPAPPAPPPQAPPAPQAEVPEPVTEPPPPPEPAPAQEPAPAPTPEPPPAPPVAPPTPSPGTTAGHVSTQLAVGLSATPDACDTANGQGRACVLVPRTLSSAQRLVAAFVAEHGEFSLRSAVWMPVEGRPTALHNVLVTGSGDAFDVTLLDEFSAATFTRLNTIGKTLVMIDGPR
jgi:ankyrin repeat protein